MLNRDIDKEYEEKMRREKELQQQRNEYLEEVYKQRQKFISGRGNSMGQTNIQPLPKTSINIETATGSLLQRRILEEIVDTTRWNNNTSGSIFPDNPMNPNNINAEQLKIGRIERNELDDSDCIHSLGLFSKKSSVRRFCYTILKKSIFKRILSLVIFQTSLKLAIDTYFTEEGYIGIFSQVLDSFAASIFLVEAIMKIIIFGLFVERGSYLKNKWNVLDFCIAIAMVVNRITDKTTQGVIYVKKLFAIQYKLIIHYQIPSICPAH